jgi:2-polyprenyl-3-methyl-5-hydroxy-6-metoxy-1,4-benzoquinol methylase
MKPDNRLTTPEFWDSCYEGREQTAFDDCDWKNYVPIQLVRLLESLRLDGKAVCEVGGGDAATTAYLAKHHPTASFSVIDFSQIGCALASKRALLEGVTLNICQADLFDPPIEMLSNFDLVVSHGVVEHFIDLGAVMAAKKRLINKTGKLFTLIPNLSSPIYSSLCKRWSMSVFEDHVSHDMKSFIEGHKRAGLRPIKSGYLGAIDFGILSMALNGPEPKSQLDFQVYLWLTRVGKIIHFLECRTFDFPKSKLFSPFMYVISSSERMDDV